jgi:hypothetical protein
VNALLARFARLAMIATLVAMAGAHWALLQSVAWTTMLADNLRRGSVAEAVSRTFDGKHPCPICKAIASGKKTEKKRQFTPSPQKFEFSLGQAVVLPPAPAVFELVAMADNLTEAPTAQPPSPPPRARRG